jgi:vacuolar protein sorting-associated protein 41
MECPWTDCAGLWWPAGEEPLYYLVSPKDLVVGRPRDLRDRVEWLLEHGVYEEALSTAESQAPAQSELCEKVRLRLTPGHDSREVSLNQIRFSN